MTDKQWLLDESQAMNERVKRTIDRYLNADPHPVRRGVQKEMTQLAVRLSDIVIHNNKKWFGEADIRLDTLVVHGGGETDSTESFYAPTTFRFGRIADGAKLPIGESGLLIFLGKPLHFLDLSITVSRDRKDSDDLAQLLSSRLQSADLQAATGTLLGLAIAAPQVATVVAAVGAAAAVGEFAYQVLQKSTGATIGLYRTSWLQFRDNFGMGEHPADGGSFTMNDLSFRYEIVENKAP